MFPEDFYTYLQTHTLTGIKSGKDREKFTSIWMVNIGDRVFARSWNKSEKSWFTSFLKTGKGEIRYGKKIITVKGKKLDKKDPLNKQINKVYIDKYNQPGNIRYAVGFSDPGYADYTMEFFI